MDRFITTKMMLFISLGITLLSEFERKDEEQFGEKANDNDIGTRLPFFFSSQHSYGSSWEVLHPLMFPHDAFVRKKKKELELIVI